MTNKIQLEDIILVIISPEKFSLTFVAGRLTPLYEYYYLKKYINSTDYLATKITAAIYNQGKIHYKNMNFLLLISYVDYMILTRCGGWLAQQGSLDSSLSSNALNYNQSLIIECDRPHKLTPTSRPSLAGFNL